VDLYKNKKKKIRYNIAIYIGSMDPYVLIAPGARRSSYIPRSKDSIHSGRIP
jgi:hypothetical protein